MLLKYLTFLLLSLLTLSFQTLAKDVDPAKNASVVAAITLSPAIEGAGLLSSAPDGSLGFDLWKNSSRKDITDLLEKMPANSHDPHMQKLIYGLLLSKTDPSLLKSDEPIEKNKDLLSLRLNKLIEGGAYKQALDLYSSLSLENPQESIAKAGILSMLFRGEKSLACLELNTVKDEFSTVDFFKTMSAYCDATLSPQSSKTSLEVLSVAPEKLLHTLATQRDFSFSYSPYTFDRFSLLEQAVLVAESKISIPSNFDRSFKNVPPSHLEILMINPSLSAEDKFVLNLRALEWGLITNDDYKKLLISFIDLDARKDPALEVPAQAPAYERLAYLLQISINKKLDSEKWVYVREAYKVAKPYGISSLTPFADILNKITPEKINFHELETSIHIMARAGYPLAPQWAKFIKDFTPAASDREAFSSLVNSFDLADLIDKNEIFGPINPLTGKNNPLPQKNNIIENIDSAALLEHTPDIVYGKKPDLTKNDDYVMPTAGIQNRLLEAAKQGYIGETVLLVTVVLRDRNPWEVNPELLRKTTQSLSSVGLTEISEALRTAAALGNSKDL